MVGINLNETILYKGASLRFFEKNERHVNRFCEDDVLLLVFEGTLCFLQNGKECEVKAGQYCVQRHQSEQIGHKPSDSPKYLYVHFLADWSTGEATLPAFGTFDYTFFRSRIEKLDRLAHEGSSKIEQTAVFLDILSLLYHSQFSKNEEDEITEYLCRNFQEKITLETLSHKFNYSKNQIINIFKKKFSQTPIEFLNNLRIKKATYLIEVTSQPIEGIAEKCGFQNYSHFYRLFLRQKGVSPAEWRQQFRTR